MLARYDLVGVDPRGTGHSQPVRCTASTQEQRSLPYATAAKFPVNRAQERPSRQAQVLRRLARECQARNGDLLDHVGTLQVARDLDVLRAAVGDRQINFYGLSYGTFLGQVIANTFPNRTSHLVLDGVVDPAWASRRPGSVGWLRRTPAWQLADPSPVLPAVRARRTAALRLRHRRRPAAQSTASSPRACGPPRWWFPSPAIGARSSATRNWSAPPLTSCTPASPGPSSLSSSRPPTPATRTRWPRSSISSRRRYPRATGTRARRSAARTPTTRATRSRQLGRHRDATAAPYVGSLWAYLALPCALWRGHATERYTGPWSTRTRNPVLIIGTSYDPATPYSNAVRVRRLLPNSTLLTVHGVGHTSLFTSSCATTLIAQYLLTGAPRPPGHAAGQGPVRSHSGTSTGRRERSRRWKRDGLTHPLRVICGTCSSRGMEERARACGPGPLPGAFPGAPLLGHLVMLQAGDQPLCPRRAPQ